jgi:hypothetical protein
VSCPQNTRDGIIPIQNATPILRTNLPSGMEPNTAVLWAEIKYAVNFWLNESRNAKQNEDFRIE